MRAGYPTWVSRVPLVTVASRRGVVWPLDPFPTISADFLARGICFLHSRETPLLLVISHFAGTVAQDLLRHNSFLSSLCGYNAPAHPRGSLGMEFLEEMFNFDGIIAQARPRGPGRCQTAFLMSFPGTRDAHASRLACTRRS